ncbi:Hypothetical protein PBC10988_23270 [Planctomycetales bacterium 10988]|nr:Hypothetical protein PBC10988_23270 [Planctomycetales bacterium 10988]
MDQQELQQMTEAITTAGQKRIHQWVSLDKIAVHRDLQHRLQRDDAYLDGLVSLAKEDHFEFNAPIELIDDGEKYLLWDGHYRYMAATEAGWETIWSNVLPGNEALAYALSLTANPGHGLRYSNQEKRVVVEKAWQLEIYRELTLAQMSRLLGVTTSYLSRVKQEIQAGKGVVAQQPRKNFTVGKNAHPLFDEPIGAAEVKRSTIREALKLDPHKSNTSIAKEEGVSRATVAKVRRQEEQKKKEVAPKQSTVDPIEGDLDAEEQEEKPKKKQGYREDLPPEVREPLAVVRPELSKIADELKLIQYRLGQLTEVPGCAKLLRDFDIEKIEVEGEEVVYLQADLRILIEGIELNGPAAICPRCGGKKCRECGLQGWVTWAEYQDITRRYAHLR